MRFARPEWLYLLILIPACGLAWWLLERHRSRALAQLGSSRLLSQLTASLHRGRRRAKSILVLLALTFLILAMSRPQLGARLELVQQQGVDVMIVLDTSASMLARDVVPDRLGKAKLEAFDLLDRLPAANTGLVVFAGTSFVQFPLTTDQTAARTLLQGADVATVSVPGTSLGEAIRRAAASFDEDVLKYKVILLLTDGEDHGGDAIAAAREAADRGVVIYSLGFGNPEGEPIPVLDDQGNVAYYKKDRNGRTVMSRLDETTLREVGRITGGAYFRATPSGQEIEVISDMINQMEQKETEGQLLVHHVERFQIPLALSLAALTGELLISERRRVRDLGVQKP